MDGYIGPYIRCKNEIVTREYERDGCPKCEKDLYGANFCPTCGTKNGRFKITKNEPKINHWKITQGEKGENVLDRLAVCWAEAKKCNGIWHDEYVYYVNNSVHIEGMRYRNVNNFSPARAEEITPEIIESELALFKKSMAADIARVEAAYGKENVTVQWGLLISEER